MTAGTNCGCIEYTDCIKRNARCPSCSRRNLCSNEVHTGLYLVRAKALKERMIAAAESTAKKLLDQIQTMSRDSNEHVCHTYASMATGVTTVGA